MAYNLDRNRERLLLLSRRGSFEEHSAYHINDDSILDRITKSWERLQVFLVKVYDMGLSDPRLFIFGAKYGLAIAIVSILIFFKEPLYYISQQITWAIITLVTVFEFSIGATLSKGFNHIFGTFSSAVLALGVAEISTWAGEWQEVVIVGCIFIAGVIINFVKLYPSVKPFEHGFIAFMTTFSIVLVSGTSNFYRTAYCQLLLAGVATSVCLIVSICFYPIWAGEDLHCLIVKNFRGVATSLEECVRSYLQSVEYERIPSKILVYQATDDPLYTGYRSALESSSQEDALLGFAIWEPLHGRYNMFRYPWAQFVKVSGALRHCAFMVLAMHGCILSEIQAAPELRLIFRNEIHRVGIEGAKVLRELGNKLERLEKLSPDFELLDKVHQVAEELQMLIDQKSYHLVKSERWSAARRPKEFEDPDIVQDLKYEETSNIISSRMNSLTEPHLKPSHTFKNIDRQMTNVSNNPSCYGMGEEQLQWPSRLELVGDAVFNVREVRTYESASALSLTNFTSSLIEFVARLQNLLNLYQELSEKARFSEPSNPLENEKERLGRGFWTRWL